MKQFSGAAAFGISLPIYTIKEYRSILILLTCPVIAGVKLNEIYPPNSAIFFPTWVITSLNSFVGLKSIILTSF